MMDYQKSSQDINNASNVVNVLTQNVGKVGQQYKEGVREEREMNMLASSYANGVSDQLVSEMKYGIDRQKLYKMSSEEIMKELDSKGISKQDPLYNKLLKLAIK